jgi:uncharacterized protein (DUF1499 family)
MNRRRPGARTAADNGDERLRGARLATPFAEVWTAALRTARDSPRWTVTEQDPGAGRIVAEATTPLWRFVDDVVIQISLDDEGFTRVDLTSHSRVGRYDFGSNARRIRAYLRRLRRSLVRS